ncbi:MAG: putative DsbA family dithiol-disulfide isomerase [Maricaulis maris]|jgi:predicted DsbA family dithiol-disulfide isomerase|uniref:DSBA oxidoreductase n=1 Tax=Maricaulis maris (strain MCS10) TaxID=394221 RepID=Q0AS03_MARMM|nr:DsbA family oxidoreductase [Maricaulis maris]ABI64934.1 DSBA oxidoreductase [Maricaulis maris MCS10]
MTHSVSVDIVSDLVCPWCWLGKRHWDQARKLTADIKVETVWRPYQLDPTLAREGRPYKDYMREKFSGAEASGRWKAMRDHLEQAGPAAGIDFRFDDIAMRPNTLDAHRLMRWAGGQGRTAEMAEALFSAFFAQGRDIGDRDTLAALAGDAGLDSAVTADLLATDKDEKAVWEEELFYRKLGVSGVPTYIFNGRFAVSGAQEPAVLADAIRQAVKEPAETE